MSRTERVLRRYRQEHPVRECFATGCALKLSEHWFEHGSWHPHAVVSNGSSSQ
ncbi:MAG TPA: hypothetical protein VGX00_02345 [Thermoplasmata archaeon]|nr:hypothetical protein [Thermoplasmata archaeon]